jgi:small subunit ribosomal protein S16
MIRLSRRGARKQPIYRIVVIEKDRSRDGRSIEVVGLYNPRTNPATVDLKNDRIEYWLGKGAQFSPTLARLYKNAAAGTPAVTAAPLTPATVAPIAPIAPAETIAPAEAEAAPVAAEAPAEPEA